MPRGMIGRIYLAGQRTSWVILLTDLNSRIPVTIAPGNVQAILAGDNSADADAGPAGAYRDPASRRSSGVVRRWRPAAAGPADRHGGRRRPGRLSRRAAGRCRRQPGCRDPEFAKPPGATCPPRAQLPAEAAGLKPAAPPPPRVPAGQLPRRPPPARQARTVRPPSPSRWKPRRRQPAPQPSSGRHDAPHRSPNCREETDQ